MGIAGRLSQAAKYAMRRTRMGRLSNAISEWYASHPISDWQRVRVDAIRKLYDGKMQKIEDEATRVKQLVTEEFMQYEIDFLVASESFKEKNPGKEWHPDTLAGNFATAKTWFRNLIYGRPEMTVGDKYYDKNGEEKEQS